MKQQKPKDTQQNIGSEVSAIPPVAREAPADNATPPPVNNTASSPEAMSIFGSPTS